MSLVQLHDARIEHDGGRLILSNECILREISLADGLFSTTRLVNRLTGHEWIAPSAVARECVTFAGHADITARFAPPFNVEIHAFDAPLWEQPCIRASATMSAQGLTLHRFYQIYPSCPATVCWTELSGAIAAHESSPARDRRGRRLLPESCKPPAPRIDIHDGLFVAERHLRVRNVIFTDCTDLNDSYVQEEERDAFDTHVPWLLDGNLLVVKSLGDGEGFFLMKESPVLADQPDHPDADFLCDFSCGLVAQVGWGITPHDLQAMPTVPSWRTVVGVFGPDATSDQVAAKLYLRNRCREVPARDWLVTANQWGDRREGKQLSDSFVRAEIDRCSDLGIEAYMLDAGWQTGDIAAVNPGGVESPFYGRQEFWAVDRAKFPDGLKPLAQYARDRGIQLLFWHNPDPTNQNANSERDAEVLTSMWRDYGACSLKIDGVWNTTRLAEVRNREMLEGVITGSGGAVSFQLDITQGVRWGFLGAIPLGVLFVENRYTHWKNYFPYKVHRNLWELSKYLRPQRMQFEFLNNAPDRLAFYQPEYAQDDPFTPEKYSLDYLFATVMFANPLAFMEPSALTEDQCASLRPLVAVYRQVRDEMFRGEVYPLGEKPSGRSLTAFQSHDSRTGAGFICAYREVTQRSDLELELQCAEPPNRLRFELLMGSADLSTTSGACAFHLPDQRSYALFRYSPR